MKVLMTGGGTGGHIYPAIAIADKIKDEIKDVEILFAGTDHGLEKTLVPKNGYEIEFITASGLSRKNPVKMAKTAFDLAKGTMESNALIKKFQPDVVIGTGGYVCAPVIRAAHKAGVRSFIHEANAFPGMTNKMLEPYVEKVFIGFEKAAEYFKEPKKHIFTGNPVRKSFFTTTREEARAFLGIPEDEFMILSFGGSQGAGKINKAMTAVLDEVNGAEGVSLYFGTGSFYYEAVLEMLEGKEISENVHIMRYIDNMDKYLVAADVVVSRAGALSVAELTACKKASILIPSPNVTGNHQYHNAKAVADVGGSVLIEEKELTDARIKKEIMEFRDNPDRGRIMGENAQKCAVMDSTDIIFHEIFG